MTRAELLQRLEQDQQWDMIIIGGGATGLGAALEATSRGYKTLSGLVTITGGKWTTYRKMGEETINLAARIALLPERPSRSAGLPLHGATAAIASDWPGYGSDAAGLEALCASDPSLRQYLHPDLPYRRAELVWGIRHEWAESIDDLLSRRTRALLLDARAAIAVAPLAAALLADELGKEAAWQAGEIASFTTLAQGYLP